MALLTIAAQLEETQTAITAVLAGQSFTVDGVTFTRANLSALQAREEYLQKRYARSISRKPVMTPNFSGMAYD